VTEAKRQVFGAVGIDMLAGPSELVVLADASAVPAYVAADLLSRRSTTRTRTVALVTDSEALAGKVERSSPPGPSPAAERDPEASLSRADAFLVRSRKEGIAAVNRLAPEHLSIVTADPWGTLEGIRNAGTAFLGPWSPVAVGDYIAGINHTLPTGGCAVLLPPGSSQFSSRKPTWYHMSFPRSGPTPRTWCGLRGRRGLSRTRRRPAAHPGKGTR